MIGKKILSTLFAAALLTVTLAGCASPQSTEGTSAAKASITFLNSKGEIQSNLEEVAKLYQEKTGVKVEIIACPAGTSPFETISRNYNSGTPPTMAMLDTTDVVSIAKEKALDLSDEKWVADAGDLAYRIDGKVYSFPTGAESKGLLYNKTKIEELIGREFKPEEYATLDRLKGLLEELKGKGMETPVALLKEDWSLGAHFAGQIYESQSEQAEEVTAFIAALPEGKTDLAANKRFDDVMNAFDVLKEYNINKADPLSGEEVLNASYLGEGEVAFLFNGNWGWPNIAEFAAEGTEFGLMPVPLTNDENDYANTTLIGIGTKQVMIDRIKATPEQQQAAKDFFNWLVYDQDGQKAMVQTCSLVPVFKDIAIEPNDGLSKSVKKYIDEGKWVFGPMIPSDHWSYVGASMQKYLVEKIDRAQLAGEMEDYWKTKA